MMYYVKTIIVYIFQHTTVGSCGDYSDRRGVSTLPPHHPSDEYLKVKVGKHFGYEINKLKNTS